MTLHLDDLFDYALFIEMKSYGFIKVQYHPEFPDDLAIVKYTAKAQNNYHWNDVTLQCRGLIYNPQTYEIIARPFPKFFNHDESQSDKFSIDDEVIVFDMLDGSLGISYKLPTGEFAIATCGSFASEQALWATNFYRKNRDEFRLADNCTDLFEIIYPDNQIVVDYAGREALVYLGTVDIDTGQFEFANDLYAEHAECLYEGRLNDFQFSARDNRKGVVVVSDDGKRRVKMKYDEYVRLHRIVTQLSERSVWEMLGGPLGDIDDLIRKFPEEHAKWAGEVATKLVGEYMMRAIYISEVSMRHKVKEVTRKEAALAIKNEPNWCKSAIFNALDGKGYVDILWKSIEPKNVEKGN